MNTLFIRLPSRAAVTNEIGLRAMPCPYAVFANDKYIAKQGVAPLSDLAETIAQAQRVILLLAASDVTLLRTKVPPLSPAKLKLALPNLMEEQIIGDPSECVVIAGTESDSMRNIAVARRDWLDQLNNLLNDFGARQRSALPAQLCLPFDASEPDTISAAVSEYATGVDLSLRSAEHEASGLSLSMDQDTDPVAETLSALNTLAPAGQITLYVPQTSLPSYQDALRPAGDTRISVSTDNWTRWIEGAKQVSLDLFADARAKSDYNFNWRTWRWPLVLSAMVLLINIAALNFNWLHSKREADALRTAMFQTYRSAYPEDRVVIDPLAQMQQKIAAARHRSGHTAPDDFSALIASFGEAWNSTMSSARLPQTPEIAALEYVERRLRVRLKQGAEVPIQQLRSALALRNLALESSSTASRQMVLEIRSSR